MADESGLPTICEPGRHQNCLHTTMRDKKAQAAKGKAKPRLL